MKILLWATSLQADILALALQLDQNPDCELLVVTEHAQAFRKSPIARHRPLRAALLDRAEPESGARVMRFGADVVVCDNHFPPFQAARRVCSMWHGLGWKARPKGDLPTFYKHVRRLSGIDPRAHNPRFVAQCYHERDRRWRVEQWNLHPESCVVTGSAFADLLRTPAPYSKAELEKEYGLDLSRKTLLVNVSWHYGRIFPGSWRPGWFKRSPYDADLGLLRALFERARDHGANVLFCLHDKKRYEPEYLQAMHRLAAENPGVCVRHKDEHPDNWADLSVADAMVSNLSSFTTFFYQLGKPAVHLCPLEDTASFQYARFSSSSGLRVRKREGEKEFWMNHPTDNGGLTAFTAEEAVEQVSRALREPDCCREKAEAWLSEHVAAPPESASARLSAAIADLARAG